MFFRLKAFGLHVTASVCVLSLVLGGLYVGWYYWPGWYLLQAVKVTLIVAVADVVLGPILTLVVASPAKARRALARDIALIAAVQLAGLLYGAFTLWHGRPLYYAFSSDRLEVVQASDIDAEQRRRAARDNPAFAPHWYSRPRWVWAPLPADDKLAAQIVNSAIFGGNDVTDMPFYFKPWEQGWPRLREQLAKVDDLKSLGQGEKRRAHELMSQQGLPLEARNAIILYGYATHVLVVFDPQTLAIRAILALS
jgi:hypothetical protein